MFLLEAAERLVARDSSLESRIEILLAGVLSTSDREAAERSPLVRAPGYLSHPESIGLIRSADLLFLPMQNLPPGRRSATVPGKTYEYMASLRPILAAVPDGDAREFLLHAGTAHVCRPDDVDAMVRVLAEELARTTADPRPNPAFLVQFEYRSLAERVAELVDHVVNTGRRPRALSPEPEIGKQFIFSPPPL